MSREKSETGPLGTVSYSYDLASDLTQITLPNGFAAVYSDDLAGEVTGIAEGSGYAAIGFQYDNLGNRTLVGRANNVGTSYSYDGLSRLTIKYHTFPITGWNESWGLSYSPASQLISRLSTNSSYDWGNAYNITRSYTANGLNQLTTSGGQTVGYDARGNLVSDSTYYYGYDASISVGKSARTAGRSPSATATSRAWSVRVWSRAP